MNQNLYYNVNNKLYNIYNNIYNLYNYQNISNINEYYSYIYFKKLEDEKIETLEQLKPKKQIKISTNINLLDSDSEDSEDSILSPIIKDDDTDETSDDSIFTDEELEDINVENYNNELEYKTQYYNTNKQLSNTFFDKEYNELCKLEKRPSIISKENIEILQQNEKKGIIKVNNKNTKVFTDLINLEENIINVEIWNENIILDLESIEALSVEKKTIEEQTIENKTKKIKLALYKGREYKFRIKYNINDTKKYKLVLAEKLYIPSSYDLRFNLNNIITKNIKYKNENDELSYDEYLNDNSDSFELIFNYRQTIQNDENSVSLGLLSDKLLINIEDIEGKLYSFYSNNNPKKYYYDKELYGDNYFVCLPGKSSSSKQLNNSDYSPNFITEGSSGICCMKKDKHKITSIQDNYKKKPYKFINEKPEVLDENDYKLKHLKLGKIPKFLYDNIKTFMNIQHTEDKYTDLDLKTGHMYRLGILEDNNISNLILAILYTIKYENLQGKLHFIKNNKYFTSELIKEMFSNYITSLDINDLITYNSGIYYQFSDNLLKLQDLVFNNDKKTELNTSKREKLIRDGLIDYINNKFTQLDLNLVIDMMSDIFKVNIIIIEISSENDSINSSIRCNNINKKTGLNNTNYDNYFIILKMKDIYQPLVMYNENKKNMFKIVFNLKDEQSQSNIYNLYNKCLLKYNNTLYKEVLVNSIYHNISIDNYLILEDNHLEELLENDINIKYVINMKFIKVGILLSHSKLDDLYIPLNYLKHSVNYLSILNNKTIKHIWFDNIKTSNIIKTFTETQKLIKDYYNIHNNILLNLNNKYITHTIDSNTYIIGIGLNINEFIPIKNELITNIKLNQEDILIGYTNYISDSKKEISIIKDLRNNNINTAIYYKHFLEFIGNKLKQKIINQEELTNIILTNSTRLRDYLNNELEDLVEIVDNLDEIEMIQINNNEYELDNLDEDDMFVLTKELFSIFLDYLEFDLINNNYRREQILNNLFNKKIILKDEKNNIILDEKTITNESIYDLYNTILSDKFTHLIGEKYNIIKENNYQNTIYCNVKTKIVDDEGKQYVYYNFKKLLKTNDINYSNCIYYHIGKHILNFTKDIIKQTRLLIANQIKTSIENNNINDEFIDLSSVIYDYTLSSNSNLYNNIQTIDNLVNILLSDKHWLTYLDLVALTEANNDILLYIMYCSEDSKIITDINVIGQKKETSKIFYIYMERFYNKDLYYYMEEA